MTCIKIRKTRDILWTKCKQTLYDTFSTYMREHDMDVEIGGLASFLVFQRVQKSQKWYIPNRIESHGEVYDYEMNDEGELSLLKIVSRNQKFTELCSELCICFEGVKIEIIESFD